MTPGPSPASSGRLRFFLGGRDLEMIEIARLLDEAGLTSDVVDRAPPWGARASLYLDEIRAALAAGERPVLVELADDLPGDIDRDRLILVDHHGTRAGADQPSSLRQVFALVNPISAVTWTRRRALVEANDIGHAPAMRTLGATSDEIRAIRDADRRAQGITPEVEAESRRAVATARRHGRLLVVETSAPTSSAIVDFLLPEYDGSGDEEVFVATAATVGFYGNGEVIAALSRIPGSWYGGSLPQRGFWGAPKAHVDPRVLADEIAGQLERG